MTKKINLKTKKNDASVEEFINAITDKQKRDDCLAINELMKEAIGDSPKMWGSSIIGYGSYSYTNTMGTNNWFLAGFSPRKANITLYIMAGFPQFDDLLKKLGKFSTGKSCLYIKKLEDIDKAVLKELIEASAKSLASGEQPNYS